MSNSIEERIKYLENLEWKRRDDADRYRRSQEIGIHSDNMRDEAKENGSLGPTGVPDYGS